MLKIIIIFLSHILVFFNTNLFSDESDSQLKVGLLAPFSGEYKSLGNSLLLSTQLALEEIGDNNIMIIPQDTGSNNKDKLNEAVRNIENSGAKVVIGPVDSKFFDELNKYKDMIFISLSNKNPKIDNNIISIGISLESQLDSIEKLIASQNKKKTVIMFPKNQYSKFIEEKIKNTKLKNYKIFKYNPDPKILTGEIEKLTNYSQRKKNLELRKKLLEKNDDDRSKNELIKLEQRYTLGNINFDSVIIIDFGNNLKSVLASLAFTDVSDEKVLFTTVNQWFDKSIFYENSVNNLYYPSVNMKNFNKYNKKYIETFKLSPKEVTILAYDALGLIYYVWKKNKGIESINDFIIKDKIKGKIGNFNFKNGVVTQDLKIYKTQKNKFIEY